VGDNHPVTPVEAPAPRRAPRAAKLDSVGAAAVDAARAAAEQEAPDGAVGGHLEVVAEGDRVVTHLFSCLDPGYHGWRWAVTVARVPRARSVTVDEVVLLPGAESLLAPPWLPWSDRVRPGDLGPGDVLPADPLDPRLVPGVSGEDDLEGLTSQAPLQPGQWEIGLGRERVLSELGRDEAADRWWAGDHGPESAMAKAAPARCTSCGFLLVIGGPMGQAFGLCANEMSPSDGHAVALDHGCGAHSAADVDAGSVVPVADPVRDDLGYDALDLGHS
jgi:hypothetical protein